MECRDWWDALFPDAPPVGFLLRQAYPQRWLRIHSLPDSKRYADTETEYAELLARHNAVATDVLGQDAGCYLIEGFWMESERDATGWITHPDELEKRLRFKVSDIVWKHDWYDGRLRDIADWKRANVVFASRETQCIYAPYDGGADLILRNEQERDERKQTYKEWLSKAKVLGIQVLIVSPSLNCQGRFSAGQAIGHERMKRMPLQSIVPCLSSPGKVK